MRMRRETLTSNAAVLFAVIISLQALPAVLPTSAGTGASTSASLIVFPDGWVDVTVSVVVNDSSPLVFRLDGEPHYLLVEGDGLLLNYTSDGRVVRVDPMGSSVVNISYQTPSLTSKVGAVWNLTVNLRVDVVRVYLPKSSRIMGMSSIPQGIELRGEWMELTFDGGEIWIAYRLDRIPAEGTERVSPSSEPHLSAGSAQPSPPPQTTIPSETRGGITGEGGVSGGTTSSPTNSSGGPSRKGSPTTLYLMLGALAASLAALGVVKLSSRRRKDREGWGEEADGLEERIISLLRERDGREYQSTIIREIGEPRATVWRKLRRMEREGKIRLRKEGRLTLVELTDPYARRGDS